MPIVRWFPLSDVDETRDKERRVASAPQAERPWRPLVDVREDEEGIQLKVELPGVANQDVQIDVKEDVLTIKGERKQDVIGKGCFYCQERPFGPFERSFVLPNTVDATKIIAESKNGVLAVKLPRKPETKPRQIEVKFA